MSLIAKGAKRPRSGQKLALLQPFQPIQITYFGHRDLKTLTNVESLGDSWSFEKSSLYCAFYVNELIARLHPTQMPGNGLFELYESTLADLQASKAIERSLREFELQFLAHLGMGLDFFSTCDEEEILPNERYHYVVPEGFVPFYDKKIPSYLGAHLLSLGEHNLREAEVLSSAKHLMRRTLAHYLGNKPLKSRELFLRINEKKHDK